MQGKCSCKARPQELKFSQASVFLGNRCLLSGSLDSRTPDEVPTQLLSCGENHRLSRQEAVALAQDALDLSCHLISAGRVADNQFSGR